MKTQSHKIISLIIVFLLCISCNNNTTDIEKLNTKTTEEFDLKRFHDNKTNNVYEYVVNDTIVKLYEEKECYKKEVSIYNGSFKYTFVYNKTTNSLVNESGYFYGLPIGVWRNYDENGNLIKSENYDEGFDFTVKDLIVMLKKELQIDLINNEYQSLFVNRDLEKRFYFIDSYYYLIQIDYRTIKVDGKTGVIISDETRYPGECVEY
ncbi:MAG: hypothetical protein V4572_01540 [Bacteroidota bacterium]